MEPQRKASQGLGLVVGWSDPVFSIGDAVKVGQIDSEKKFQGWDYGIVIGLNFCSDSSNFPGWIYKVAFYEMYDPTFLELPYIDEIYEEELKADTAKVDIPKFFNELVWRRTE